MDIKPIEQFYQVEFLSGKRKERYLKRPINFNLILTKRCNANCIHCCASANDSIEEFSLESLKRIIDIAEKNKVFYLVLTGGEPLLHPNLFDFLELCHKKLGIVINTNGTLITEEIAKKFKSLDVANVHVSLDGSTQESYAKQRGCETKLQDVIRGISCLVAQQVPITTKMVVTSINYLSIEDIIKLSISLGVKKLSLAWFKPVGRGLTNSDSLMMSPASVSKTTKNMYKLKKRYSGQIQLSFDDAQCFPFLIKEMDAIKYNKLCGDYFCRIDHTGSVYPCPFLDTKVGNVFATDLEEIWKNPFLLRLRKLSHGKALNGVCKACPHNNICMGGCRSRAAYINNDLESKDPLCWVNE